MIISHPHQFIFIHVHRTGEASFETLLHQTFGKEIRQISEHDNAKTLPTTFWKPYQGYFTFGFVRNPWARILSWYLLLNKFKHLNEKDLKADFEFFLQKNVGSKENTIFDNYLLLNQVDYFIDKEGVLHNDYLAKFENYASEVRYLMDKFGELSTPIPHLNQTKSRVYQDFYSIQGKKLIQQYCQKDLDYFAYQF